MSKQINRRAALAGLTIGTGILATATSAQAAKKHPRLEKAIEHMKDAKQFLTNAPSNFGGHKKKALEALTDGINQLEKAMEFDS